MSKEKNTHPEDCGCELCLSEGVGIYRNRIGCPCENCAAQKEIDWKAIEKPGHLEIPAGWVYEDQLPKMTEGQYGAWYMQSRIIGGVRMGPAFPAPAAPESRGGEEDETAEELFKEAEDLMTDLLPPETYGEDYDCDRLYEILKTFRDRLFAAERQRGEGVSDEQIEIMLQPYSSHEKGIARAAMKSMRSRMSALLDKEREEAWVSTDDKMPEYGIAVLVRLSNDYITIGYFQDKPRPGALRSWALFGPVLDAPYTTDETVTHWRPIPAFLAGKEGKNPDKP